MPIELGATPAEREAHIDALLAELRLDEKVDMLSGHGFMEQIREDGMRYCARAYHIGAGNPRLGIPPFLFNDGPRGVAMGASTCFPVPMARGASFDPDLERRIGDAIGRELRAQGANLFGGVCINLLRHPAWGRAQETYGEDPFLLGEMGAALTAGVQHHNVVATPKHFAANSMENARFTVDVEIDERALREVYLPHFKRCVDEGAGAVMSAYNQVNGSYCGHHRELLTHILKEEWGFEGFVYSDFVLGCRGWDALPAGLDVEAPDTNHFGQHLLDAVERGDLSPDRVDDAVRRVLRSLFRTLAAPDPEDYRIDQVACTAHLALAREAAAKSIVLLRNEGSLPWEGKALRQVLVVGPLAGVPNLGDHGSSRVYPPTVATPLDGLRAAVPAGCEIVHDDGADLARLRVHAARADAVLVVAGYTHRDEGEYIPGQMTDPEEGSGQSEADAGRSIGGDRNDLTLGASQEAMILAAAEGNPDCVVAVMAGSAVIVERWRQAVGAILMLWYPGMEGGSALADVLLGRVNPSGRLPFSIPGDPSDLPSFDRDAIAITYDLWHGYTKMERDGTAPAFPFGFGLSYTGFATANPTVRTRGSDALLVEVDVTNCGAREGATVVQVYAGWTRRHPEQPVKRLVGFVRVELAAAATERVEIPVDLARLAWFDPSERAWRLGESAWTLWVGQSSSTSDLQPLAVELPEQRWSIRER